MSTESIVANNIDAARRIEVQRSYYSGKIREFGINSARSVGWTEYLQFALFERMLPLFSDRDKHYTLLDVGSGMGDFVSFLRYSELHNIDYNGIDILGEMLKIAKGKYAGASFSLNDFSNSSYSDEFDIIICSGALNIIVDDGYAAHHDYVKRFIQKMYRLSRVGCAFNLLALQGKAYFPDDDRFYYTDHNEMFKFCDGLCGGAELHCGDYDYTFTILMRKPGK